MSPRKYLGTILILASALAACEGARAPAPVPSHERRTTSPTLAVANLGSQIAAAKRHVETNPSSMPARKQLVGLLLARTQYLGTMNDFDEAFAVVNDAIDLQLAPAQTAVLHAQVLSSVHRFDEASAELDRAESLGAQDLGAMRQTIALARGSDPGTVISERDAAASAVPSYASQTRLAAALSSAQRFEDSDKAYQRALAEYRDVSPFPIAWVAFQRGVMWGEAAGDHERAREFYRKAVATLPQYVVGNVHLAELEAESGDIDAAILRLKAIVDQTVDPEPASRLAQFLEERDPRASAHYAAQADRGYQDLLSRYPLAFADHAAEFYLGAGHDAERALELALLNLENRQTSRAYHLAVQCALAAEQPTLACELAASGKFSADEAGC